MTLNGLRKAWRVPLLALPLAWAGCLEVQITTTVNRDGTLGRTAVLSGDSSDIVWARQAFAIDTSWTLVPPPDTAKKPPTTLHRTFSNAASLTASMTSIPGERFPIDVSLDRTFQWFFTTFSYRERWKSLNPYAVVPVNDYISPQMLATHWNHEIQKQPYPTRGDSLAMVDAEARLHEWEFRNRFEVFMTLLLEGAKRINDPSLQYDSLLHRKDALFERLKRDCESKNGELNADGAALRFERALGNPRVKDAFAAVAVRLGELKSQEDFMFTSLKNSYTLSVVMPGLITATNGRSVEGSKVTWENFVSWCYLSDMEMQVESRVVNWWAVIVTAVVVVVLVGLSVAGLVRRGRYGT